LTRAARKRASRAHRARVRDNGVSLDMPRMEKHDATLRIGATPIVVARPAHEGGSE